MIKTKSILQIILIIFSSIRLYSSFDTSLEIDSSELFPTIDLNDREVVEEEIRKINQYKLIEGETIRHLISEELDDEEKSGKLRSLAEYNLFDDVAIVDPTKESYRSIGKWFVRSAKQFSSTIVLYPYQFTYNHKLEDGTSLEKKYENGGFLSIRPEELNGLNIGLKTHETLKLKKAKALYDADIAILNINGNFEYLNNINFFDEAVDWCTYFQTYLGKGTCYGNYQDFLKQKTAHPEKTFVTWINETEINNNKLINDGLPRFGILIVPDYLLGAESIIKTKLNKNKIIDYYNKGGIIFVSGKSGILLQDFGLIAKGTYNQNYLVTVDTNDRLISTKGCEETHSEYNKNLDFNKQLACASLNETKKVCVASTFFTNNLDPDFKTLIDMDTNYANLKIMDKEKGVLADLTELQKS